MYLKLRYFSEYIDKTRQDKTRQDKTRQDSLIIFSTDKNTIKDLAPLVAKANRGGAGERKIKEIW